MTMIAHTQDGNGVRSVDVNDLARPMKHLVATGQGLAMLRGLADAEVRAVDRAMWTELNLEPGQHAAVLLRFRALIEVFGAPQLKDLFLRRGHALIALAVQVAAGLHLEADKGFETAAFTAAIRSVLAETDRGLALAA